MIFLNRFFPLFIVLSSVVLLASKCKDAQASNNFIIETKYGNMEIMLYDATPKHRDNFKKLVYEGFYDSLMFHRVIKNFMVQGGDPDSKNAPKGKQLGNGGPGYTVEAEIVDTLFHKKGALAAARLGDKQNPEKRSSGSQFYLVQGKTFTKSELDNIERSIVNGKKQAAQYAFASDSSNQWIREKYLAFSAQKQQDSADYYSNLWTQKMMQSVYEVPSTAFTEAQRAVYQKDGGAPHLDQGYTVFGEIVDGLDILDSITLNEVDKFNRPLEDVIFSIKPKTN